MKEVGKYIEIDKVDKLRVTLEPWFARISGCPAENVILPVVQDNLIK